jgi:hypothetical protein
MANVVSVDVNDLVNQMKPLTNVGSMSADEFGTLLAQKSKTVANTLQSTDYNAMLSQINNATGLGKYGLSAGTLESTGYLKAGTAERFLNSGTNTLKSVLDSPQVWTGKDGINNVSGILGNELAQTEIIGKAFNSSLSDLQGMNILSGKEASSSIAALTNVTSEFGIDNTAKWLDNNIADAAMGLDMDKLARSGMLSTDFVTSKTASLTGNLPDLGNVAGNLSGTFNSLAGSIGGISAITGPAGQLLGSAQGVLGGALGNVLNGGLGNVLNGALGGAFGSLFGGASGLLGGKGGGPKVLPAAVRVPRPAANTVQRAGVDTALQGLLGNTRAALPNFSGIVNASAFNLPSLSGLPQAASNLTSGGPVTVTRCDGAPELIGPTQAECEAAGGTWVEYTINTTSGTLT